MRDLIETLGSLVKPLFNGIFDVLTGGFGWITAVVAWVQLAAQFGLAKSHTISLASSICLAAVFFIIQAAAGLWSFLIVNGAAYETNPKKVQTFAAQKVSAVIVSALFVLLASSVSVWLIGHFAAVNGRGILILAGVVLASVQAVVVVSALERMTKRK